MLLHILSCMKLLSKLLAIPALLLCLPLCAFTFDKESSLKELTCPFINTYECVSATLGEQNLLDDFEYLRITILDEEELEVSFKKNGGKRHAYTCPYTCDAESGALTAEMSILGFRFRQTTTIKDGRFTLCLPILNRPLIMKFEVK